MTGENSQVGDASKTLGRRRQVRCPSRSGGNATEEGYDVVGQRGTGGSGRVQPDLVVMDVKMPKLDGISAAEQIANERIAPVVMLTAFSQRELVERASQAGAMAYVVKPFGKGALIPRRIEIARAATSKCSRQEVSDLCGSVATAADPARDVHDEAIVTGWSCVSRYLGGHFPPASGGRARSASPPPPARARARLAVNA